MVDTGEHVGGYMSVCRVSLICTLKNEVSSIDGFLDSIVSQSKVPDELIIVDGGSTDGTTDVIESYIRNQTAFPIKLFVCKGVNIAQGRNIAIKYADFDIIASTDLGCVLDKDWLKNLIRPFEENSEIDVVSGWYEPDARTTFEKIAADVIFPKLDTVIKNQQELLPSSRSVAYKKTCWESVGGYPEWLYTAEDTLYDINLKKAGCRFAFAPDAVVYWRVRPNLKSVFKQYYLYAKGDGQAGTNTRHYAILLAGVSIAAVLFVSSFYYNIFWIGLLMMLCSYCAFPFWRKSFNFREAPLSKLVIRSVTEISGLIGFFMGRATRARRM